MKENKNKELLNYILENYDVKTADDVAEAIKDMFKDTIQGMINAEFDTTIGYEKNDNMITKSNYRNGKSKKTVKSKFGEFNLDVPRDRNSEFDPIIVPKHQRNISGIEDKIINLYARGLSTREISEEIEDIYGIEVSHTMVSNITDTIIPKIKEWQYRPLQSIYPIIFIDAMHFNVKEDNRVIKKAAYIILGITTEGYKEIIGIWIGENESAKFWLGALNDLKNRGVKEVLIICSDGLTGIKEAITAAFPKAMQQRCIVHLIRNSVKFVSYKHLRKFCQDLKSVYHSIDEKQTKENLHIIKKKWEDKYPTSLKVWEDNWDAICTLFNYSKDLRRIMYTTNAIESLNRTYRKYTKTKGVFPNDESLMKSLYLATMKIENKWTSRYKNWDIIYNELSILFKGRI